MRMVRLNKYLADCGVASRRKCDQIIFDGQVAVNGTTERRMGVKIDERADEIKLNDQLLQPTRHEEYILLNKPKGFVTTVSDEKSRKTVLDLVQSKGRIFPVGRLDINTAGLLLLTNDGELTYKLTHPKFKIDKIYEVRVDSDLKWSDKKALEAGIELEEGVTSECAIEMSRTGNKKILKMTLHQGWKRQVRRMFEALGYEVLGLKRIGFASLNLDGLKMGGWRRLTKKEVEQLKRLEVRFGN